ncbi:aspartic peptidase domain-containing protein [Apodospora peruviana]|uniref:Aspartic peptidase domain-containing protein n=1 Tax=Apodospora peruviana TaxID=516989 RepID=A0AAE0IVQ4_9PEZI|nr:aspartic peptidase domain-containing protein [Apodospora peruviana]
MSSSLRFLAAALPAAVLALDGSLFSDTRVVQEPGLIRVPVTATNGAPIIGKFAKRQVNTDSLAAMSGTLYTVNIGLGSPGQTVPVQFDTGSSELWVNPVCSKSTTPDFCNAQPRFTSSTTLVSYGVQGSVTYGTGYADFSYMSDYVRLGAATLTQQIFGVAYDSSHSVVGIMGVGPDLMGWTSPYPYVIDSLAQQGLTNSRAFSMDLRGFASDSGSVIYGGIDTKKYSGSLFKIPVVPASRSPDGWTRWWVRLDGIKVNQPDGNVVEVYTSPAGGSGQPVLLDSGYTLSALPTPIFTNLVAAFPSASYVASADLYIVDCQDPGQGGSVDFIFGTKTINVQYYDFVWHYPGSSLCVLGAFEDSFPVLGDTFLRSAYVVYDWDNRNVHLAQSAECGTNLVAIGRGANAVPNLVGECELPAVSSAPPAASSSAPVSSVSISSVPASVITPSASAVASSTPVGTITYTYTNTYTITSCPLQVTNCHPGHVTTEVVAVTTTVCPQTTATYAIPHTYVCPGAEHGCNPGETITTRVPITLKPGGGGGGVPTAVPTGWDAGAWPRPTGGGGGGHGGLGGIGNGVPGRPAAPGGGQGGNGGHGEWSHPTGASVPALQSWPTAAGGHDGAAPALTTLATQAPAGAPAGTGAYGPGGGGAKPTGVYTAGAAQMRVVVPWLAALAVFRVML